MGPSARNLQAPDQPVCNALEKLKITCIFDAGIPYSRVIASAIETEGAVIASDAARPCRTRRRYSSHSAPGSTPCTARHQEQTQECAVIKTGLFQGSAAWLYPFKCTRSARNSCANSS